MTPGTAAAAFRTESTILPRGSQYADRNNHSGNRLDLSMTIWMTPVRRTRRNFQSSPDHNGTAHVHRGFNSISDQHIRVTEKTGDHFYRRQHDINGETKQRDPRASLQIVYGSVRMLRRDHR